MRTARMVALVALLSGSVAFGASQIVYTLELGGDNHADLWEANQAPAFTPGVTSGVPQVGGPGQPKDLTWAVRVSVGGTQDAGPGAGSIVLGAANLVFDLELYNSAGQLVANLGAAPLVADGANNVPDLNIPGFWSSINDGDTAGARGGLSPDILANAAFAISIHNLGDAPPAQLSSLIDPLANGGPNFDYGWYPTANGRSGVDIAGTKQPVAVNNSAIGGKLVGFGAGYKSFDGTSYAAGVGKYVFTDMGTYYGFGAFVDESNPATSDPLNPPTGVVEKALFEGQLSVRGLDPGTYTLKVVPSADGNNVLHYAVEWWEPAASYGGFGSFAVKADAVYPTEANNPGMSFEVFGDEEPAVIVARKIFYNDSYFDFNNPAIQTPGAGTRDDDADAIDPTKSPLMTGTATFANWTGYNKGINGLIYDIKDAKRDPLVTDFTFTNKGKAGSTSSSVTPTAFAVQATADPTVKRVVLTFQNVTNCWLEVTIGTGFGLNAAETHWWGNAVADCGTIQSNNILVDATDEILARNNKRSGFSPAPVSWAWDYNKDHFCDGTDEILARNNKASGFTCVKVITRP